jgi:hypothetical protein
MFIGFIGLTAYSFACKVIIFKTQGETACRGTEREDFSLKSALIVPSVIPVALFEEFL